MRQVFTSGVSSFLSYAHRNTNLMYGFKFDSDERNTGYHQKKVRNRCCMLMHNYNFLYEDDSDTALPFMSKRIIMMLEFLYNKTSGYQSTTEIGENIIIFAALALYHELNCWKTGVRTRNKEIVFNYETYRGKCVHTTPPRLLLTFLEHRNKMREFWIDSYRNNGEAIKMIQDAVEDEIKLKEKQVTKSADLPCIPDFMVSAETRDKNQATLQRLIVQRREKQRQLELAEMEIENDEERACTRRKEAQNSQRP